MQVCRLMTHSHVASAAAARREMGTTSLPDPKRQKRVDRDLGKAEMELAKADFQSDQGMSARAFKHYEKAWKHAENVMRHAFRQGKRG